MGRYMDRLDTHHLVSELGGGNTRPQMTDMQFIKPFQTNKKKKSVATRKIATDYLLCLNEKKPTTKNLFWVGLSKTGIMFLLSGTFPRLKTPDYYISGSSL